MSTLHMNTTVIQLQLMIRRQLTGYKVPEDRADILRQLICKLMAEADQLADPPDFTDDLA